MAGRGCSRCTRGDAARRSRLGRRAASRWRAPSPRGFARYLPMLTYPIRTGTHVNTAFALIARAANGPSVRSRARRADPRERPSDWFGDDRDCQAWEPGGDEFLSPALIEALCMARVPAAPSVRARGSPRFLPRLAEAQPASAVHPRHGQRPQRRQDRASRRAQPERAPGAGAASPPPAGRGRERRVEPRPSAISPPRCRTSPATIWASTGWRPSRCWRLKQWIRPQPDRVVVSPGRVRPHADPFGQDDPAHRPRRDVPRIDHHAFGRIGFEIGDEA